MDQNLIKPISEPAIAGTCNSCKRPHTLQQMVTINSCQHICCKNCLIPSIVRQLESGKGATCPGEKGTCQSPISDFEVQNILPDETYQKLQDSFMEKLVTGKNLFECKNPLCGCSFEVQGDDRLIRCPSCQAVHCVPCQKIHVGKCPLINPTPNNAIPGPSEPKKRRETDGNGVENSLTPVPGSNAGNDTQECVSALITKVLTCNMIEQNINHEVDAIGDGPGNVETEAFHCQFCYKILKEDDSMILDTCSHFFCKDCIKTSIEKSTLAQIPCPLQDQMSCMGYLTDAEVKDMVDDQFYEEYTLRSLKQALEGNDNVFQCKTPNCGCWCEYEPCKKTFLCPVCNKLNCLQCKAIHDGVTCETYQEQVNLGAVDGLMEKERQSGWSQLTDMIQHKANPLNPASSDTVLEQLADAKLLENTVVFECPICMADVNPKEGIILQECLHTFCKQCLIELVEHSDEPVLKCPYMDGNYSCVCHLLPREVKALIPPEQFEKYIERVMKFGESSIENSFHCRTPNCRGWCLNDENEPRFECPLCGKISCMDCKAQHEPYTCEEYKRMLRPDYAEIEIDKLVKLGHYMKCPKCSVLVQKVGGCDWMVCRNCRTELCWATKGPRWGPKGPGDISGGCRCQVDGKKCHPKCQNCH